MINHLVSSRLSYYEEMRVSSFIVILSISTLLIAMPARAVPSFPPADTVAPPSAVVPNTNTRPEVKGLDIVNKCREALEDEFAKTKKFETAKCNVYDTVANCKAHISCDRTSKDKESVAIRAKPQPSPSPTPKPQTNETKTKSDPTSVTSESTPSTTQSQSSTESTSTSEAESSALSKCQSAASSAESACADGGDDDSYTHAITQGITDACKEMQDAGLSSGKSKSDKAKACQDAYMSCTQTCSDSAGDYTESDNWTTFNSLSSKCLRLSSKAKAMLTDSSTSLKASSAGTNCLGDSGQSPQSASGQSPAANAAAQLAAAQAAECAANPAKPGCSNLPEAAKGSGQFASNEANKGSLNVADTSGLNVSPGVDGGGGGATTKAPTVAPIANNTGGGIPGGSPSRNNAEAPKGLMGRLASAITDIEKGFLGGGGSSSEPPVSTADETSAFGTDGSLAPQSSARTPASQAADLKRYLPGGDRWQGPGYSPATIREIHGQTVDLWSRITNKMQEKCRLGQLLDCK